MIQLWPELLVLLLFLASDFFLTGMAAAAGGLGAGLVSFLVLLIAGRRKPSLLVEGLIFGGVTALGVVIDFPGGNLILMELVIGVIFLISVPLGWDLLEKMTGKYGRGLLPAGGSGILALALGMVFTIHGAVYAFLAMSGSGGVILGAAFFAVLYLAALRLSSPFMKRARGKTCPEIVEKAEGEAVLKRGDTVLGEVTLQPGASGLVRVTSIEARVPWDAFLPALEEGLKMRGFFSVLITSWEGDPLELEMNGFVDTPGGWRKRL